MSKQEQKTDQVDNRVLTLAKKTSKAGSTYYSVAKNNADGTVTWLNSYYATVSKKGTVIIRKQQEQKEEISL
jgi:hypothetical protein